MHFGFPGGSDGKESACKAGDLGLISGLDRSPREGNGNPLHCSPLENPIDRAIVHGVTNSQTWLTSTFMYYVCEKYYKPITVKYYIANSISWVPRLTMLDLQTNWT